MADSDRPADSGDGFDPEELQRMMRELLGGEGAIDPNQLAQAAGLPMDPAMLQQLFQTLQRASQQPDDAGIDWDIAKKTALDTAGRLTAPDSAQLSAAREAVAQSFTVASLWLSDVTVMDPTADAPRQIDREQWVRESIARWIELAAPVAESIARALTEALTDQLPEQLQSALPGAEKMLRSVGGALFATQLGAVVGNLSGEVVAAGDVGIPLVTGPGSSGGSVLPENLSGFAAGLEQPVRDIAMYLTVRELAHARLFRHAKWLGPHVVSAVSDYARGIHIDADHIMSLSEEIDPSNPQQLQELMQSGSLIPPRSPMQEAALARLETLLALIEGWVDAVTLEATQRIPEADAIAEMVRRRRATGGPAERAFGTLVGLHLRPKRLREAARMWAMVAERGGRDARDGLWEHPDILPTADEVERPALLLERLGLAGEQPEAVEDDFDRALAELLDAADREADAADGPRDRAAGDGDDGAAPDEDGLESPDGEGRDQRDSDGRDQQDSDGRDQPDGDDRDDTR